MEELERCQTDGKMEPEINPEPVLKVFRYFCNNLYLGQWEIAAACIQHMDIADKQSMLRTHEILQHLIRSPYNVCMVSTSVPTPYHLAWLCLQEIIKLDKDSDSTVSNEELIQMVEFPLLLLHSCENADPEIIKDLFVYHKKVLNKDQSAILQTSTKCYLSDLLYKEPAVGDSLLRFLLSCDHTDYCSIYMNCLVKVVRELNSASHDSATDVLKAGKLIEILSLFDPDVDNDIPEKFLESIVDLSYKKSLDISQHAIYSALQKKTADSILERILKIEFDRDIYSSHERCLSELGFDIGAMLSDNEQVAFKLLSREHRQNLWRNMFLLCFRQQEHFFEIILNAAFSLIKAGEYDQLNELLKPREITLLKPLVLLLGWNYCYSCSSAKKLLQILWDENEPTEHQVLNQACKKLLYQVDLVQWCLEKSRPLLVASGAPTTRHDRATEMFQGLEAHSLLYVLYHSTQLSSLQPAEVLNILQKRPVDNESQTADDSQPFKSVRFAADLPEVEQPVISIEQERDISIYHSYCAMKCFMDAVYFCAESTNFTSQKLRSSDENVDLQVEDFQALYHRQVTDKINSGKLHLSKIYPLSYRVEVLENIYSLLFVTHEDIQELTLMPHSDSEHEFFDHDERPHSGSLECSLQSTDLSVLASPVDAPVYADIASSFQLAKESTAQTLGSDLTKSIESDHSIRYDEPFVENNVENNQNLTECSEQTQTESIKVSSFGFYNIKIKGLKEASGSEAKNKSGDASAVSTASTGTSISKLGFILNPYVVRDILASIKECIVEISGAKFGMLQTSGKDLHKSMNRSHVEKELIKCMNCSISDEHLNLRINQLTQYVSEALWRFQLVSGDDPILTQSGKVPCSPDLVNKGRSCSMNDEDFLLESEEEAEPSKHLSKRKQRRSDKTGSSEKNRGSSFSGRESEALSQDTGGKRLKKRRQSVTNVKRLRRKSGIISKMLASKETLLNMCLRRGHFAQANQVIKFFNMDKVYQAKEMEFAEQYHGAVRRLQALDPRRRQTSPALIKPRAAVTKINIQSIKTVAAAAEASTLISSIADEVLSGSSLPAISDDILDEISNQPQTSEYRAHINQEHIPAMIVLDLATTACRSWDASDSLLDLACKRMPQMYYPIQSTPTDSKKTRSDSTIKGVTGFLNQIRSIASFGASESAVLTSELWKQFTKSSVNNLLTNALVPLDVTKYQSYIMAVGEIERSLIHVNKALREVDKISDQIFIETPQGRKRKSSSADRPIVHIAIKHLMQVLEKHVKTNGVLVNFEGSFKPLAEEKTKNFIQSLYDHVKVLAFLEAECQSRPKDTVLQPFNYFRMLKDSPTTILGKLMFVKKISPYKLEKVAQKLNLNLTKIIVNSCCPHIPSKLLPPKSVEKQSSVVLNSCDDWTGEVRHPEIVTRELLTKLVTIMKAEAGKLNCNRVFDVVVAKALLQSNEVWDILYGTGELAHVDLKLLSDAKEKKCFYSNLINLMTIHSFLYQIDNDILKLENSVSKRPNILDRMLTLCRISYQIGQLGTVSLFDLKYFICRDGFSPPSCMNQVLLDRLHELDVNDPWLLYAPPTEARLLFVTTDCYVSSPPVQVLAPELVRNQLETAMVTYLEANVVVDEEKQKVTFPQMLVWHRFDFVGEKEDQYCAEYEGLINFVASHTNSNLAESLQRLLELEAPTDSGKKSLPFKFEIRPYNFDHSVSFISTSEEITKSHRRAASLPVNVLKSQSSTDSIESSEVYNLRAVTLEYLKAKCSLVATLISLVCSDEIDDIEEHMDETFFDSQSSEDSQQRQGIFSRSRTSSDMSIVDVRSYRYQRVIDDFPSIHQHLLAHVVPIAAADNFDMLTSSDPVLKLLSTSIDKRVRESMFCMHNSPLFQENVNDIVNQLMDQRKWGMIATLVNSLPAVTVQNNPHLIRSKDFAICCSVIQSVQSTIIGQINDSNVQTRLVLGTLKLWSVSVCIDLLEMCYSLPDVGEELKVAVKNRLEVMEVYKKITECAKSQQIKLSVQMNRSLEMDDGTITSLNVDQLETLTTWQSVVTASTQTPEFIVDVLSRSKEFIVARKWSKIHNVGSVYCQTIEENYILCLLQQTESNVLTAFQSLETLVNDDISMTYSLCRNLLLRLECEKSILFIAQFVLRYLTSLLTPATTKELQLLCLGAKALQVLPELYKSEYSHLVGSPILLIEQLLMNMKVEWAAKALKSILPELSSIKDCNTADFNKLIIVYSSKALEFAVVQVSAEDSKIKSLDTSTNSLLSQNLDLASLAAEKFPAKTRMSLANRRASIAVPMQSQAITSVSPLSSSRQEESPLTRYLQSTNIPFVMPPEPPPKSKWVPDAAVMECMVCQQERFSMFNRRHHCRRCGRVVCAACSSRTTIIRGISARTCDDCYEQIFKPRPELTDAERLQQKLKDRLSGNRLSPGSLATTPPFSCSKGSDTISIAGSNIITRDTLFWKLHMDDDYNAAVREEFSFDQAPSTSLCISILQLHSNANECGHHMLKLCDDLSRILKPIAPGVANPEVDYTLVISMMKYLLFNAKLKFMECNDSSGLDQCEQVKGTVDLVNLLVSANCKDIPSILELTKLDAVRRLRDRLIEDERLALAMEVSTKYRIDPIGVWAAWGKACLKLGDFPGAREKFSRCLKVPNDRHVNQMPTKLLCDVVNMIGNQRHNVGGKQAFLMQLKSMKDLISEPARMYTGDMNLDDVQFEECLYYLKTYGNYLALVDFLRRHGYLQKALMSILEKKCSGDVFVDGLLHPCMKSGNLGYLLEQMVMIDPSIEKWQTYLTASCKFLFKMKYTNVLYEIQVFMKDYFRAAMTCINVFYQQDAKSYGDLLNRTHHLITAKQHMEAYMSMSKWNSGKHLAPSSSLPAPAQRRETPVRLKQSMDEVTKYIETINHQIEITKFLQQQETKNYDLYRSNNVGAMSENMPLPTLFGNSKMKGALVYKILTTAESVKESFQIAADIITKYKLNAPLLITQVCRQFARERAVQNIHTLSGLVQKSEMCDDQDHDEIIGSSLRILVDNSNEGKDMDMLIKLIKNESNKINAFILCGKLKDAYLCAVKKRSIEDVRRIASVASMKGQTAVKNICESWLQQQMS